MKKKSYNYTFNTLRNSFYMRTQRAVQKKNLEYCQLRQSLEDCRALARRLFLQTFVENKAKDFSMYSCLNKSCEITSEVIRTKRSSNVHRAFTVHLAFLFALPSRFACARRSHPLNQFHSAFVHRSFTHHALCLRSTFFQRALYVYSPFMCVCRRF